MKILTCMLDMTLYANIIIAHIAQWQRANGDYSYSMDGAKL